MATSEPSSRENPRNHGRHARDVTPMCRCGEAVVKLYVFAPKGRAEGPEGLNLLKRRTNPRLKIIARCAALMC